MMAKLFVYTMPLIYIHAAKVYTSARPTEVYSTFTFASYTGYGTKAISIVYSLSIGAMHGSHQVVSQGIAHETLEFGGSGSPYMSLRSMTHDCEHGASWLILWCRHMPPWVCPIMSAWLCLNPHPRCSHCWRMYVAKNSYNIRS